MRVAMIVDHFPSFSETFILRQITGLLDRGHDVHIFPNKKGDLEHVHPEVAEYNLLARTWYSGLPSGKIPRFAGAARRLLFGGDAAGTYLRTLNVRRYGREALSLRLFYTVARFIESESFDVLHCQLEPTGLQGMLFRRLGAVSCPLVTSWRGHDFPKYVHRFADCTYSRLFDEGELFLPVSESLKNQLTAQGCAEDKIRVLHSGIDLREFAYRARGLASERPVRVVSVGRLVPNKGIHHGLNTIALLRRSGLNIEYHVVGDGPERGALEKLAVDLAIRDCVIFHGWKLRKEVCKILENSDLLAAPSIKTSDGAQEGIPNTLKEAMAMGMPVVGTYHSGIPELVEDGKSGYLVPEADDEALASALRTLAGQSEAWAEMGRQGRRRVEQEYDINKLNDQLVSLYQEAQQWMAEQRHTPES